MIQNWPLGFVCLQYNYLNYLTLKYEAILSFWGNFLNNFQFPNHLYTGNRWLTKVAPKVVRGLSPNHKHFLLSSVKTTVTLEQLFMFETKLWKDPDGYDHLPAQATRSQEAYQNPCCRSLERHVFEALPIYL